MFKANISPLVAEQYKRTKLFVVVTSDGERVIVDPAITVSRVYMVCFSFPFKLVRWLKFLVFLPLHQYRITRWTNLYDLRWKGKNYTDRCLKEYYRQCLSKFVGYYLAYTLPTVVFLLCPIVLFIGRNRYIRSPPTGSVLASALHLFAFAARDKWCLNPVTTYKNFTAPGFWENAKPSKQANKPAWMTYDDLWVDELARGITACGVFCWFPVYCTYTYCFTVICSKILKVFGFFSGLTYNQLNNNLTSQAATMQTHGLPNDILSNLDPIVLIIFIPVCDLVVSLPFLFLSFFNDLRYFL